MKGRKNTEQMRSYFINKKDTEVERSLQKLIRNGQKTRDILFGRNWTVERKLTEY